MTSSVRLIAGSVSCYLNLQPAALLLLPDLCNSILLVADNSRQLKGRRAFTGLSIGVGSGPQIGIQKGPLRSKFLAQVGRSTLSIFIPPHTRFTEARVT